MFVLDPAGAHRVLHHALAEAVVSSSLSAMRSHSAACVMPGCSIQTPTIIIRLTSLSMRSHAVSTRDMRLAVATSGLLRALFEIVQPRCWVTSAPSMPIFTQASAAGDTLMADLKKTFEKAVADSKNLPEKPDNATLLKIYSLYKAGHRR